MKTTKTYLTGLLMVSSLSFMAVDFADTMVITYHSGQVQHVAIEQPSEEVKDIGYLGPKEPSSKQAGEGGAKGPSADARRPALKIKWAAPVDQ